MMQSCEPDFEDEVGGFEPRSHWDEELRTGADFGDIDRMRAALAKGADIDGVDQNKRTPLHRACMGMQMEAARFLLDQGAAVDPVNSLGGTPLSFVCGMGEERFARMLIAYGANVDAYSGVTSTPLLSACRDGRGDIVRLLIESGSDPLVGSGFVNPVVQAFANGRAEVVKYLIEAGVVQRHKGHSLLSACVDPIGEGRGQIEAAKLLFDLCPEVVEQIHLDSALLLACQYDNVDFPCLLIDHGANVNYFADFNRSTPLMLSAMMGNWRMVGLLLDRGADVTLSDEPAIPVVERLLSRKSGKDDGHARVALQLMRAMGLSPLDKVGGKPLLGRFSHWRAKEVIRDAQRAYRAELLAESIDHAMGDDEAVAPTKASKGFSL